MLFALAPPQPLLVVSSLNLGISVPCLSQLEPVTLWYTALDEMRALGPRLPTLACLLLALSASSAVADCIESPGRLRSDVSWGLQGTWAAGVLRQARRPPATSGGPSIGALHPPTQFEFTVLLPRDFPWSIGCQPGPVAI